MSLLDPIARWFRWISGELTGVANPETLFIGGPLDGERVRIPRNAETWPHGDVVYRRGPSLFSGPTMRHP